ncbi:hypothetical protein JDV02_010410 [Purpureocillium takamizusanense]|uniref:Uncharacterized protein n=1 Tax=Purpureocillium takamizusanense TaxID=2060973 RepID=A0A9Q8VF63_9HYPO|nr:uncharacterized protein JDV02_010410 [Purpureocillium takamizusanense]UNI24680.1 hypothetical protein JDV02_010410 [Purpureocillium takamizusanense]
MQLQLLLALTASASALHLHQGRSREMRDFSTPHQGHGLHQAHVDDGSQPRWLAEMEGRSEYQLLDNLTKDPHASIKIAVSEFLGLANAAKTSDTDAPLGEFPRHVWQALIEIGKRTIPEKQGRMVEFVARLENTTMKDHNTGQSIQHKGKIAWIELPELKHTVHEAWREYDKGDRDTSRLEHSHWENLIALLAQLSAAGRVDYNSPKISNMDFATMAEHDLHKAFQEQDPTDPVIRSACMWLMYASPRLWADIQHKRVFHTHHNEGLVLTMHMWNKWSEGLRRAKTTCRPETCPLVNSAIGKMQLAEGEGQIMRTLP